MLTGPSPVDRSRAGSKHHLITDRHGTPLAVLLNDSNRNDVTQLLRLLNAVPPVRGRIGRPRRRPDSVVAARGYDHDIYREQVRDRGIVPAIARRGARHGTGLGTYRWVVERTLRGTTASDGFASGGNTDLTTKCSSNSPVASSPIDRCSP